MITELKRLFFGGGIQGASELKPEMEASFGKKIIEFTYSKIVTQIQMKFGKSIEGFKKQLSQMDSQVEGLNKMVKANARKLYWQENKWN